jgi:hypothetical protein
MPDLNCLKYILSEKQSQAACAENPRQLDIEISLIRAIIKELS